MVDDINRLESFDDWYLRYIAKIKWYGCLKCRCVPALYGRRMTFVVSPKTSPSVVCSRSAATEDGINEKEPIIITLFDLEMSP